MNIFVLDKDVNNCAKYLCDIHLNKMVVEHTQMLTNCYSKESLLTGPKTQSGNIRKYSHYNHPASIWTRQTLGNFKWLWNYTEAMIDERMIRGFSDHFCKVFTDWVYDRKPDNIVNIDSEELTPFYLAVPEQYKQKDPVESYRQYYINDKVYNKSGKFMLKYTNRELPYWFTEELKQKILLFNILSV